MGVLGLVGLGVKSPGGAGGDARMVGGLGVVGHIVGVVECGVRYGRSSM